MRTNPIQIGRARSGLMQTGPLHGRRAGGSARAQAGLTLLEVLIAVVVFSVGLLGIGTLQVAGMKHAYNSNVRATAVALAENMSDRLRTNRTGIYDGNYNLVGAMPAAYGTDCNAATCNAAQMATFDLVNWHDAVQAALPVGLGYVCIDSTAMDGDSSDWECDGAGDVYAIKIQWTERRVTEDDTGSTGAAGATESKTFVMRVKAL